jgi:D-alanyl-D-alanine dipeptidase
VHARSAAADRRARGNAREGAQADPAHARDERLIRAVAIALVAIAACKKPAPTVRDSAPSPVASPEAGTLGARFAIPATTNQLVTAITADWDAVGAELRLWTRDGAGWKQIGDAWRGVVGRSGTSWGSGLHGRGAPAGRAGPIKREGDGKSPAGVFDLTSAFGYAKTAPSGSTIGYQQVDTNWKCVDDPRSREYNRVLDARSTTVDWKSAEEMRRGDDAYEWVVEVAHNASRTPMDGSCIFLHVWSGPDSSTVGCTAMEEAVLASLIAKLSPADRPAFVLLPRAEYDALAETWNLPREPRD